MRTSNFLLKLFAVVYLVISVMGCKSRDEFSVDPIHNCPADEDGVGCFFNEEGKPERELFAQGTDNYAYMAINGKLCKIQEDTTVYNELKWEYKELYNVYRHKKYVIVLQVKDVGETEGGVSYKGILRVKDTITAKEIVKKISGRCGC